MKAALHTSLYLASKCWWLSQESIQFQIYVFRRDFIECPARAIFITQRERRLIAFFCCRCCRITRPFIISRMSETLFPISPSTLHASAQHFSSYSTSAHFYCGRWCSLTLSCCAHSHSHTHIIYGADIEETISIWHTARQRALNWSCCCCFSLSHPPRSEMYFKIDPSFWNVILYNVV